MIIAGVMSGSSLDGLDIAIVRFAEDRKWHLLWSRNMAYAHEWGEKLKGYQALSATEYIRLKADYSYYIADCLLDAFQFYSGKIDFISFHGHTLMHLPGQGVTEQIGNGGIIAARLNIPTITDFRVQDVAKGGVGTPLAPLVELNLFEGYDYYLNLGGIANITKLTDGKHIMAYDVCPCNQVLNHFSNLRGKEYDKDGLLARSGQWIAALEAHLDTIAYFRLHPPKSLDNNWIKQNFIPRFPKGKVEDILHTYTHWMSAAIAHEVVESAQPTSLMVSGGGAHNVYFMEILESALLAKNCSLFLPSYDVIDYKEAILMSLMAHKYLLSESNVLSIVTGASSDSIGGALYKVVD